ncbi:MAG: zinc ABC transporter substrate-binding protein, partial [Dehalococcoidales bacterium]
MTRLSASKILSVALGLVLVIALDACSMSSGQHEETGGRIEVVTSILPLADFVENVGGEKVVVSVMVPPGASPHTYEPTPSQMTNLARAKMYAKVGSGVEFEVV